MTVMETGVCCDCRTEKRVDGVVDCELGFKRCSVCAQEVCEYCMWVNRKWTKFQCTRCTMSKVKQGKGDH